MCLFVYGSLGANVCAWIYCMFTYSVGVTCAYVCDCVCVHVNECVCVCVCKCVFVCVCVCGWGCKFMCAFCAPSLKMEYEKLASEKTEMQRHSIMVSLL